MIVRLKPSQPYPDGKTLTVEYPDRETAEAQLRCMERFRKARWGFPEILLPTVADGNWCVSYNQIIWPVTVEAVKPALAG